MEAIVDSKYYKINFIKEVPCINIQWFGLPPTEEFQKGCNAVLDLIVSKKVSKVLTDNRYAKVFSVADRRWLNEEWLVRAEKAGYRSSAVVYSDSETFIRYAVDSIVQERDSSKFISKHFQDFDQAVEWLKTLP